jgi:hypothetical protein
MSEQPSPEETVRALYEDAEKRAASAMEQLVHSDSFGELLARATENTMAITRMGFNAADLIVRNLRIAGRSDIARLGRQLARTEDKLERVLQEVEMLQDQVAASEERRPRSSSGSSNGGSSRTRSSNGSSRSRTRSKSGKG